MRVCEKQGFNKGVSLMGACSISGSFVDSDWKKGMNRVQDEDEQYYGYQDGYSGASNSCSFCFRDVSVKEKDIQKYIKDRLEVLGSGDGEVIPLGIESYAVCSAVIFECPYPPFDSRSYLRGCKEPAVLLKLNRRRGATNFYKEISAGTVSDLKKQAQMLLYKDKFETDYYIVGRSKTYKCTEKRVIYKKTNKKSTNEILVVPLYKFLYYGWAMN